MSDLPEHGALAAEPSLTAQYRDANLQTGTQQGHLKVKIQNASGSDWRLEDRVAISYQVFDRATGVVLIEGNRTAAALPAAGTREFDLPISFPSESGTYNLYVSPMVEGRTWAYERRLPFLLAQISVDDAHAVHVQSIQITDLAKLHRWNWLRTIRRAITLPFLTIWLNRRLSYTLTKREILSRSRGSIGGSLWTLLTPLLLMATYFFVFGLVLKSRFENDPSPASFALYFLAGMLPWLAFSEAAGRAPGLLIEYRQMIRKIVFPVEMLPVNLVFSGLVGEAFGLVLFIAAVLLIRHSLPWTLVFLPVLLIPQMIFTVGVCWFMSALGAFVRDLAQVSGFLLTIWFFITPICYPESQVPAEARGLLLRNPLYILVEGYRAIFLRNRPPDWRALLGLTAFSLVLAILSHAWFYKLKKSFADVL